MGERRPDPEIVTDASWAHNRWPTIGLYTGAGLGAVTGIIFVPGWGWAFLYVIAGGVAGCLVGFGLAKLVYWDRRL